MGEINLEGQSVETKMMWIEVANILAVIIIPIAAVKVGQILQDRAQARKDKMDIFKTLMANRVGWSVASVQALNVIDIVFSDDSKVCSCWKDYYEKLCIQNPNEIQQKQIRESHYKLLEAMAVSLGYKDKITWESIQNPYIPQGMVNAIQQQQTIQTGMEVMAGSMGGIIGRLAADGTMMPKPGIVEDDSHAHA